MSKLKAAAIKQAERNRRAKAAAAKEIWIEEREDGDYHVCLASDTVDSKAYPYQMSKEDAEETVATYRHEFLYNH